MLFPAYRVERSRKFRGATYQLLRVRRARSSAPTRASIGDPDSCAALARIARFFHPPRVLTRPLRVKARVLGSFERWNFLFPFPFPRAFRFNRSIDLYKTYEGRE